MLTNGANWLIDLLVMITETVFGLLPDSPFVFEKMSWGVAGQIIGYFIPVPTIIMHFTGLLSAILIYYAVRQILRLVKAIQ